MNCHHNTIERILHSQLNLEYKNGQWLPKPPKADKPGPSGLNETNRQLLNGLEQEIQHVAGPSNAHLGQDRCNDYGKEGGQCGPP
uniref:Uncharacterized protein n=1 Tax=Bursaphelenchus xylophilus TaxID=6326 RepID=A0A1I7SW28_BURXY